MTSLFLSEPNLLANRVKGLIVMGAPYHFYGPPTLPPETLAAYYGDRHEYDCPYGILWYASDKACSLPSFLILRSENEPEGIKLAHSDFVSLLKKKNASVEEGVVPGHNHISAHVALSSGQGEQWGEYVVTWMRARL